MKIILVRHTRVAVPRGTCYGWTDVPVADTFEAEAAVTKKNLEPYGQMDAVFSSPLTRARKLAAYCGYPTPQTDDRLKEMNMGRWEMQRYDDIADPYLKAWYEDYLRLPTPDGESFMMQYERVAAFLEELRQKSYQQVAIFAHAGVLVAAGVFERMGRMGLMGLMGDMGRMGNMGDIDTITIMREAWHHITDYGGIKEINL